MATHAHQIKTVADLDASLLGLQSTKKHALKLTYLRAEFIKLANGRQPASHPLYDKQHQFDHVFKAMNKRATELGFGIYSFGYRKPLDAQ